MPSVPMLQSGWPVGKVNHGHAKRQPPVPALVGVLIPAGIVPGVAHRVGRGLFDFVRQDADLVVGAGVAIGRRGAIGACGRVGAIVWRLPTSPAWLAPLLKAGVVGLDSVAVGIASEQPASASRPERPTIRRVRNALWDSFAGGIRGPTAGPTRL